MTENKVIRVGIAGLGEVGRSLIKVIHSGYYPIEVTAVSTRTWHDQINSILPRNIVKEENPLNLIDNPEVDVVIETIGGSDGIAYELAHAALGAGKPLVTANKALLAWRGEELAELIRIRDGYIGYEAAVVGSVPVIRTAKYLAHTDKIFRVEGLLNGTCNFILTEMNEKGLSAEDALDLAQKKGYAEADPTLDIGGEDAAHKISILSAIVFHRTPRMKNVSFTGVQGITSADIASAYSDNKRIKLVATAQFDASDELKVDVKPVLLDPSHPFYHFGGALNSVLFSGEHSGKILLSGPGAGGIETASAIIGDTIDIFSRKYSRSFKLF